MADVLALPIALAAIFAGPWVFQRFGMSRERAVSYPVWGGWILVVIVLGRYLWSWF